MAAPKVREAYYTDIPQMATILAQAFWNGELFGDITHPHREEFPQHVEVFWQRKLRVDFWNYRSKFIVADPAQEDMVVRLQPYVRAPFQGERADAWYLNLLGVRPEHQGHGIGRSLVTWGLEAAQGEKNVWAAVIAAKGKDAFYRTCGFEFVEGSVTAGEGNPLGGREGGHIHWKRPERREG